MAFLDEIGVKHLYQKVTDQINTKIEAISDLQLLGTTPYTLQKDINTLILKTSATGEVTYNIKTNTIADIASATIINIESTLTEKEGYYELSNTGGSAWYGSSARFTISGLPAGTYTAVLDNTTAPNFTSSVYSSYITFYDSTGSNLLGSLNTSQENILQSTTITLTTTQDILVNIYTDSAAFASGTSKSRFGNLYLNQTGTTYASPFNISGTFTGETILTGIPSGATVTTSAETSVYENQKEKSILQGKTIVCFGDSIVGNAVSPYDYPSIIAKQTGANVINAGFGGCRMSAHPTAGYNAFSMYKLADAIISGTWTEQETSTAEISNKTEHLTALKAVDWNKVDIITIGYGTNDINAAVTVDSTSNTIDTNTYLGAFRYSVQKILTTYPKIQIVALTPIYRYWTDESKDSDDKKAYTYGDKLIQCASDYKLLAFDLYRTTGINKYTKNTFLQSDGTHPTNAGLQVIADTVAAKLIAKDKDTGESNFLAKENDGQYYLSDSVKMGTYTGEVFQITGSNTFNVNAATNMILVGGTNGISFQSAINKDVIKIMPMASSPTTAADLVSLNCGGGKISNVATPVADTDVPNKKYVDEAIASAISTALNTAV